MSTVRDLIRDALLDLGVLSAVEAPTAAVEAACLDVFDHLIHSLPGLGMSGGLTTKVVTESPYEAKEDERIVWRGTGTLTVNLPMTLDDGTRTPRHGARIEVTGINPHEWIYLSSMDLWRDIRAININTKDPLGPECNKALSAVLAAEVAPRLGAEVTQMVMEGARSGRNALYARFPPYNVGSVDFALWERRRNFVR